MTVRLEADAGIPSSGAWMRPATVLGPKWNSIIDDHA
jgi:hypothetical protein